MNGISPPPAARYFTCAHKARLYTDSRAASARPAVAFELGLDSQVQRLLCSRRRLGLAFSRQGISPAAVQSVHDASEAALGHGGEAGSAASARCRFRLCRVAGRRMDARTGTSRSTHKRSSDGRQTRAVVRSRRLPAPGFRAQSRRRALVPLAGVADDKKQARALRPGLHPVIGTPPSPC